MLVEKIVNGISGMIVGGVLLFFGLDLHFFRIIPKYPMPSNHPVWIFLSVLGAVMVALSIRYMIKPQAFIRQEDDFDPSGIDDPIARRTAWAPMACGANFCTHRLFNVGENRLEFRPTKEGRTFSLYFITIGFVIFFALLVGLASCSIHGRVTPAALVIIGCAFVGFGLYDRYRTLMPIVFDSHLGLFWKGKRSKQLTTFSQHPTRFNDIHALQLVSLYHPSRKGTRGNKGTRSYYSYELIAVLKDATRVSIVHHGGRKELLEDATTLSQFLTRPLWNGITDDYN
jgi:hypothetical protein